MNNGHGRMAATMNESDFPRKINDLTRTIHEPAACERELPAARCAANPGRSSECPQHACVATGVRGLRSAVISRSRLAVHE